MYIISMKWKATYDSLILDLVLLSDIVLLYIFHCQRKDIAEITRLPKKKTFRKDNKTE